MRLMYMAGLKSLASNWFRTLLTILGIALGVATVATIVLLDYNTNLSEEQTFAHITPDGVVVPDGGLVVVPYRDNPAPPEAVTAANKSVLAADYQMMRSAVRLASLLAFAIGAIIVYFTLSYSIQQRRREMALYQCLGATLGQILQIVLAEILVMGVIGSVLGIGAAYPLFRILKMFHVTTTGRGHLFTQVIPWADMAVIASAGILTAGLGALAPLRQIRKMNVGSALLPRFLNDNSRPHSGTFSSHFFSLLLPLSGLGYYLLRPFWKDVIPSVYFYLFEIGFILCLFLAVVFLAPGLISGVISILGWLLKRLLPLQMKLAFSRFRRFSEMVSWPVSNVMLVFAFLLSLHIVTRSLKHEVVSWGAEAAQGLVFVEENSVWDVIPDTSIAKIEKNFQIIRISVGTRPPNRVLTVSLSDIKKYAERVPELTETLSRFNDSSILLSPPFADMLGVGQGDKVHIKTASQTKVFVVAGITRKVGFYPAAGSYREQKTFAIISDKNADLLPGEHGKLGVQLVLWNKTAPFDYVLTMAEHHRLKGLLNRPIRGGNGKIYRQVFEINKDFIIFDVILLLATLLAGLGVSNSLLVQLQVRGRELALYQVLGMTRSQVVLLVMAEGLMIGLAGGCLAVGLGLLLGWASVEALNVLSIFSVHASFSLKETGLVLAGAVFLSIFAALYPALTGMKRRFSEQIHYE